MMDKDVAALKSVLKDDIDGLRKECFNRIGNKVQVGAVFQLECPVCKHKTLGYRMGEYYPQSEVSCEFRCSSCGSELRRETKTIWSIVDDK